MDQKNTKHILVVEDSLDLQDLLAELFSSEGYKLTQAYDGRQALELLRKMTDVPSLILLDIMMPVLNGIDFRKTQMQDPDLRDIPVVVMTADPSSKEKMAALGVDKVIPKPILDIDHLLAVVKSSFRADH